VRSTMPGECGFAFPISGANVNVWGRIANSVGNSLFLAISGGIWECWGWEAGGGVYVCGLCGQQLKESVRPFCGALLFVILDASLRQKSL